MADNYSIVAQYPTTEFLGGTQTRDVMAVGMRTRPSDIYFEFRLPRADYNARNVADSANGFSIILEQLTTITGVSGIQWIQQPTDAGQLRDALIVSVESDSGDSASSFVEPFARLTRKDVADRAGKLRAELNAAEGL